ncbi:unnamed protein product [Urochloa decumbens]|uniref:non-specific serine/threonine protein kinase n=1 Tax=Urochloa decumbens TaxID=240449 RepID=A0ABC9CXV9_9POAL
MAIGHRFSLHSASARSVTSAAASFGLGELFGSGSASWRIHKERAKTSMEPEELTYQFLREITDGFSEKRRVGEGGFGTVYMGVTKTGVDVAVKIPRGRSDLDHDFKQFENEFDNLTKVKHVNIVQFLGYCYEIEQTRIDWGGTIVLAEKTHRALCFEYLHNGSLQNHLSDESSGLDWHTRYKIIKGICDGLRYIHEETKIVHLDLKPDNILLDKDMVPKIADFGLSKIFGGGELTRTTESPLGTLGYQPPEFIRKGEISEKFDIFSLGAIIETKILQPPENGYNTVCGMTTQNALKRTEQHQLVTDVEEELIVGRDKEKQKIVASLLERIKSEKIIILPIYGIGGIGKTTFAKLIYNDTKFKFYSHVWVYVSQRFDLEKIVESIDSQLSRKENQTNNEQLISKGIVIVLDDLWEDKLFKIRKLKDMLNLGDSIKKVIVLVTTRSADIAQKVCSNIDEPYQIESLTDEMCWDIIKQKGVFEAIPNKEKLMDIGKEIAQKCRGVALAAQALGSMLHSMEYNQWIRVRDSSIWSENISKDASLPQYVLASLKLSYDLSMDEFLKKCFTYCAIFPKGHEIVKCDLIHQWISLGFIKQSPMMSILQLCEKYIARLLELSFLQHYSVSPMTYEVYSEQETVFTMHDLVHDLAISLIGDEVLDQSRQGNTREGRYCYALLGDCSKPLESCMTSPAHLRALRFLDCQDTELQGASFEPAESLRVLDLSECSIHKLPISVGVLKHLRYLNAPRIRDKMVPECITELSNLTYLSLQGSCAILALPESIGEIQGLVHLDLSGCLGIRKLPKSFGHLTSLEHLDFSYCKNVIGLSHCLARLKKLKHLNLSKCENIGKLPIALGSLTELQYLNLSDSSYISQIEFNRAEFLCSLKKLKHLNLSSSDGYTSQIMGLPEALGSLTELKYLNLSHQTHKQELPASFGNLCSLVHLDLSCCWNLVGVPAVLDGLTKLQYLDLYKFSDDIDDMEELQEVIGNLSELRHLNLGGCIKMSSSHQDKISGLLGRICTLTNLEYLNVCENGNIYTIPETLANLRKLHTLDLSRCGNLQRLPASISEIDSLKFIYTMDCTKLDRSTLPQYSSGMCGESSSYHLDLEYKSDGWLTIRRLENVKSTKQAKAVKLQEKTDIRALALQWTRDAKRYVDDVKVLRELEPPYSVSKFRLEGYNSVRFPSWVVSINAYLPDLTSINMSDLPNCNNLPPLGQLLNLKELTIRRMDSIKKIDADLYGGTKAFSRLERFDIVDMKCLEEWNMGHTAYSTYEDGWNAPVFPRLENVEIRHCPRLRLKLKLHQRPLSIFMLQVHNSDEVMLSSLETVGTAARCILHVEGCSVPLHQWSLLRHLPSLEQLTIKNCSDLACSSPDFLQGLTCLEDLIVEDCESIMSLPERLGDLTSLKVLEVRDCKAIKTLPDSMHQLTRLQSLDIYGCAQLERWCELEENKMKLAHINSIH